MRPVQCWLVIAAHSEGLRGYHFHDVLTVAVGIVHRTCESSLLAVEIVMTSACIRGHGGFAMPVVVDGISRRDAAAEQCRMGSRACVHK